MTDTAEQVKFPGPDEIEGFWAHDKMHAPRPLHPLSQDLVMSTLAIAAPSARALNFGQTTVGCTSGA